jgi:hypothetical protein
VIAGEQVGLKGRGETTESVPDAPHAASSWSAKHAPANAGGRPSTSLLPAQREDVTVTAAPRGALISRRILWRRPRRCAIVRHGADIEPVLAKPDLDPAGRGSEMLLTGNVGCNDRGLQVWRLDERFPRDRIVRGQAQTPEFCHAIPLLHDRAQFFGQFDSADGRVLNSDSGIVVSSDRSGRESNLCVCGTGHPGRWRGVGNPSGWRLVDRRPVSDIRPVCGSSR